MMARRVLVTGCNGYIGSVLVPKLLALGVQVSGLDTDLYRDADFAEFPKVCRNALDVRDVTQADLEHCDAVIHLAALSNDPLGNLDAELTYDINYRASVNLARMAKQAGVQRFLFSSSCSSYGASGDDLLDEDAAFNPVTPYGRSKVLAESEIAGLADDRFSPTFLRNATAYGASPRLRLDLVVNDFAAAAFLNKRILILSDGSPWRPLVHVEDICDAFLAILEAPRERIHAEAFNVGDNQENYRVSEVAEIVKALVDDCSIAYDPAGGPDLRCYRVNCDKLREHVPGFSTQWTVQRGAQQLLEAFQTLQLTQDQIDNKKFHRLAALQRRLDEGALDAALRPTSQHTDDSVRS